MSHSHRVQFVNVTDPSARLPAPSARQSRSHAAREAHARARRLRTMRYQAKRNDQSSERGTVLGKSELMGATVTSSATDMSEASLSLIISSPISMLASDRTDPFSSFATSFRRVDHFLLDHYVHTCLPLKHVECPRLSDIDNFMELFIHEWVRSALADAGFLSGILAFACHHLCMCHYQESYFTQLATQYKVACVQSLRTTITSQPASSKLAISKALALAFDEIVVEDFAMARVHVEGAVALANLAGGPKTLSANGFLETLLQKFVVHVDLLGPRSIAT